MSVLNVEHKMDDKRKVSVRFSHDMFPMALRYDKEAKPFVQFVIRLGAILGGLFTVSKMAIGIVKKKSE